ncbi:MAG: dipeptidase PepV [Firmicutes bacterium]|nr:dipeptidase PepV [Bacillota bacterium]
MDYEKYLEINKEEMIFALQDVIRSNSEGGEKFLGKDGEVYPFGMGVHESLVKVLTMGEKMGFEVKNVDNYGGHIDFKGKGDKVMAILGHLDVVPAGSGWDFDPYGGEVADGKIYGRGTTDNKGPVISCLYAMKALKEAGYQPECTIRLILGLDEETGWKGMKYYFDHVERPDFGFTPDADFPVINGEKGMLVFGLAKKFSASSASAKGLELRSLQGGTAPNSVADSCRAVVRSGQDGDYDKIREIVRVYKEETGYKVNVKGVGKSLEITTSGVSAHGATPWKGLNAISVMMQLLGRLNFVNEDHNDFIQFYNDHIGFNLHGENLGVDISDEPSGRLVFNVGMVELDPEAGKLVINIRYPVTADGEEVLEKIAETLDRYEIGLIRAEHKAPIFREVDSPMVKLLMDIYQKHTGDTESKPLVIGGGTYARSTPNIIAYGALFPGDEDLMHQKNECVTIERFEQMTKIYAEAIYKLSSGEYNI